MQGFISWLLVILAIMVAIPTTLLCLEILSGILFHPPRPELAGGARRRIAVVVPARNESATISFALRDIQVQLAPGDRLLVADSQLQ